MKNKLFVQSMFTTVDGEDNAWGGAGELSIFIRLKGCNLRCAYCDTVYAQGGKAPIVIDVSDLNNQLYSAISLSGITKITITGGEPLMQSEALMSFLNRLPKVCGNGRRVTIETNGSVDLCETGFNLFARDYVRFVVDYKLPSSGEMHKMCLGNFDDLTKHDVIKFVISEVEDYKCAKKILKNHPYWIAKKVFSPAVEIADSGGLPHVDLSWPRHLIEMMIQDGQFSSDPVSKVKFSLQLHKILWPEAEEER